MSYRFVLVSFWLAILAAPVSAQIEMRAGQGCTLYAKPEGAMTGPYIPPSQLETARIAGPVARVTTVASAKISVDYSGFTEVAQAAFQKAVDIWANHITSPVEIRVRATFGPLAQNVLGSAGPTQILGLTSDTGETSWYPIALGDLLLGEDYMPPGGPTIPYDINATFSSSFSGFYFGLDANPPADKIDFVTVVLHELGHGLGFIGSGDVDDGEGTGSSVECNGTAGVGCYGYSSNGQTYPLIYDRFLEDGAGNPITDSETYPNTSTALGALFQSEDLYVDAPETVRIYGSRPPIYAPTIFEGGSSYSHWDEATVQNSSAALMTPAVGRGEAYQDPGNITCAFFKDMGWTLAPACQLLTTGSEVRPNDAVLTVDLVGPNPLRDRTALRLRQSEPGPVTVLLYDLLGRRLATLMDGVVGTETVVDVDATGLAPGVYRVLAQGARGRRALSLTVAR